MIRKTFGVETKSIDEISGVYQALITTEDIDRSGDIVRATGAKIDLFMRNPVILWGHDYSEPAIAKAVALEIIPGRGIRAQFVFPEEGINPKADVVRKLWASGFLNAVSIGFIPIVSESMDSKNPFGSQEYKEWELLEFSIVNVPAQPNALRLALDGINDTLNKRGRVLSAGNEKKLKEAADAINQVLSQLEDSESEPDDKNTEHGEESTIDPTLNKEISQDVLKELNNLLDILFSFKE